MEASGVPEWIALAGVTVASGLGAAGITQAVKGSVKDWVSDHHEKAPLWARVGVRFLPLASGTLLGLLFDGLLGSHWAIVSGLAGGTFSAVFFKKGKAFVERYDIKIPGEIYGNNQDTEGNTDS